MYVPSYNHRMQPLRRKCIYKRSNNFEVILNRFFYGGKKLVPDDIMEAIGNGMCGGTNVLCNYMIPMTIPVLECMFKGNELTVKRGSLYCVYFKLSGGSFPHIAMRGCDLILDVFNVVSSIYDRYKPKGRRSFLNCSFVLERVLMVLGEVECAKYVPPLKTCSVQNELEQVWELITKDPEWVVALRK